MNILLLSLLAGIGICFGTFLLVVLCAILRSPLPLFGMFTGAYLVCWKLDRDDSKRMRIKYKIKKEVK